LITLAAAAEDLAEDYRQLAENPPQTQVTTVFIYNPSGQLIGEYNENGDVIKEYVWLDDKPLAMLQGDDIYYYHADHLNTPQILTDQQRAIVWKAEYKPFGEVDITINTVENNLRFPGQYLDSETGLHYNYFRDYDPRTGRYVESDPLGLKAGLNTYAYVMNNPSRWIDLYGLDPRGLIPDCSFYDKRCAEDGGTYYCKIAPERCSTWPADRRPPGSKKDWVDCSRKCLQKMDAECDTTPDQCTNDGANVSNQKIGSD